MFSILNCIISYFKLFNSTYTFANKSFIFQIRLLRTAREWGKTYKFWSCSDIDIVKKGTIDDLKLCSQHGKHDKVAGN